jgi:hypothetical protein
MSIAAALRAQIETALADRIPSALTPAAKTIREFLPTGVSAVDAVLDGGLPVGAVTEMIGAECSGRTALALSFVAQLTKGERVCAWIDVSNALSPESAAASGIDLKRLLWVRCGVQAANQPASSSQGEFALKQRASPMASATCCDAMPSLRVAPNRNEGFGSDARLLNRTHSGRPIALPLQPARQSPGRELSRRCMLLICFCRQVDSAQSCWTWEALRLSTSRAYRWRHGSVMVPLRSGVEQA